MYYYLLPLLLGTVPPGVLVLQTALFLLETITYYMYGIDIANRSRRGLRSSRSSN